MDDADRRGMIPVQTEVFMKTYSPAVRYGAAVLVSFLAFLLSDLLFPLFHSPIFFLPLVAVMISALFGGGGPGLLATFLSAVSFIYYFLPLTLHPSAHSANDLMRLGLFLLFSLLISWVSASFRSAYRKAEVARRQADEANRYKSRLVSNVSHDLRTPLNAIIGYTHLLIDETYGPIAEKQKLALDGIHRNAGDLLRMINDILDLAKIESGKMTVGLAPIEIPPLIEEILTEIRPLSEQKGILIRNRISEALPCIESDGMKIKQILMNLLSNAIKFTDQGEITVTAKDRKERNGIEIAVCDTGVGIPPEALSKIFEVFYQV
ncbi:MAG: HAMP domain-containing histidine kinase, partial [Candidatus Manganitrophaceae bacterium]